MNRRFVGLIVFCLVTSLLSGCTMHISDEHSLTVTDQKGREVQFAALPETIVSLAPSITEILYALELDERLIGVTTYCNYPEAAKTKTKVGTFSDPDIERIVSLQPGVVFASALAQEPVDKLTEAGISVVVIDPQDIAEVMDAVRLVGRTAGVESKAEAVVGELQGELQAIQAKLRDISPEEFPLVYYEVWHEPIMTAGPGTFIDAIIEAAGGINLAGDTAVPWPSYSAEAILSKNPAYIVIGHSGQTPEAVLARSGWQVTAAVQNRRVKALDPDIFSRPGPRVVTAVRLLAEFIHSDLFN